MGAHKRTVIVTIDQQSEPVSGTVQATDETPVEFVGYMQLIAELERHHHGGSVIETHPIGETR